MKNYFFAEEHRPYHVSAGAVVYRPTGSNVEIALLKRYKRHKDDESSPHSLPKGTLYPHESLEAAALREVKEETGFDIVIDTYIGAHTKTFHNPYAGYDWNRTTHYFLARQVGGSVSQQKLDPTEFYKVEWCKPEVAVDLLKSNPKEEHIMVQRALESLRNAAK